MHFSLLVAMFLPIYSFGCHSNQSNSVFWTKCIYSVEDYASNISTKLQHICNELEIKTYFHFFPSQVGHLSPPHLHHLPGHVQVFRKDRKNIFVWRKWPFTPSILKCYHCFIIIVTFYSYYLFFKFYKDGRYYDDQQWLQKNAEIDLYLLSNCFFTNEWLFCYKLRQVLHTPCPEIWYGQLHMYFSGLKENLCSCSHLKSQALNSGHGVWST